MSRNVKPEIYPNSPLSEVIFEIRFTGEPLVECRRDIFFDYIRDDYPKVLVPSVKSGSSVALEPYHFVKEDRSSGIMLAINKLSYYSSKYQGFVQFEKEALRLIGLFKKSYPKIKALNRTGFRYVNIIPFTREDDVVPLDRFLNIKLQLPTMVPERYNNISIGFISKIKDGSVTTRVETLKADDQNRELMLLDIDYAKEGKLLMVDVKKYLNESHKYARRLFEELITDNYRMFLKGEGI